MAKSAGSGRSSAQGGVRGPGRPVKPQDGSKSALAALSAQLRKLRLERALTLQNLAAVAESTDRGLGAYIKGYQGIISAQRTGPDAALAHLEEACAHAPRSLPKITRAWLTVLTAEALAHTGQRAAALTAIGRSPTLLDSAPVGERDPWMFDFDRGRLAAHTGHSYLALNHPEQAVDA